MTMKHLVCRRSDLCVHFCQAKRTMFRHILPWHSLSVARFSFKQSYATKPVGATYMASAEHYHPALSVVDAIGEEKAMLINVRPGL